MLDFKKSNDSDFFVESATSEAVAEAVAVAPATADASLSVDYGKLQAVFDERIKSQLSAIKQDTNELQKEIKRILCTKLHPDARKNNGIIKCCTVPKRDKPHWWSSRRFDASCKNVVTVWYEDYYCHCKSVWCCPRCSPIIGLGRRFQIRELVYLSKKEDDKECYLLTLTFRHDSTMCLEETLEKLSDANKGLWQDWKVKQIYSSFVGRVTALEIMYGRNGWHPHIHILLIGEKGLNVKEYQKLFDKKWLAMLKKVGLDGLGNIACTFEACRDIKDYLTKIPCEICGVSKKDGKFPKHLNFWQLVSKCSQTPDGARKRKLERLVFEYYKATKGRHFIFFSKGLLERYGIQDVDEEDLMERNGMGDYKRFGEGFCFDEGYDKLTADEITWCLHSLESSPVEVKEFLKIKGVKWHYENSREADGYTGDEVTDTWLRHIRQMRKLGKREARIYNPDALMKKKQEIESKAN